MKPKIFLLAIVSIVLFRGIALAQMAPVDLIVDKEGKLELPYGEQKNVEFTCPWESSKIPTVLDFQARIDTPGHIPLTGGPIFILSLELNEETLDSARLLNKPLKSARAKSSECVWFTRPKWALMYAGAWDPPPNDYTPKVGSPTQFVLDVSDLLNAKARNKLTLIYCEVTVSLGADDQDRIPLSEHCRRNKLGDATILFGEMQLRPRKDTDAKIADEK